MNLNSRAMWGILGFIALCIVVLALALFLIPVPTNDSSAVMRAGSLSERVMLLTPIPGATVERVFAVAGEAPGGWYFDASFPINVVSAEGKMLAELPAQAQSDWMTPEQVPFKALVDVGEYSGPAILILKRDNPSDMREHDASVSIPITIK